ncbi:alpha-glucosidase 2-like [Epargyreus clarus]|uniref:alpha-glucosidase 2-like n=1 Tax=Epargyreus clarus TaxID=520877 RepID=UPI003C2BF957
MIPHAANNEKDEDVIDFDFEKANRIKWYDRVLLNRPAKVVAVLMLTAIVGPLLIYRFVFLESMDLPPPDGLSIGSCLIHQSFRLPCGSGRMTREECPQPQCCFNPINSLCFHRLPSRFRYIVYREWNEDSLLQPRVSTVPYASQSSITNLKLSIDEQSSSHLTLTFYDSRDKSLIGKRYGNNNYTYEVTAPELNLVINSTQGTIFDTARGPLIASNNIWEITFKLTDESMYGLGEIPLRLGTTKVLYNHNGGLNSIPLIFARINGSFHGVLIDDSSPVEVSIQGDNNVVVRSITTSGLKLHVFVGPRPEDVMKDAMTVIGSEINLEYWMLGAHICSEIAETPPISWETLRNFTSNATTEKLPYESHCGTGPIVFNANQCDVEGTEYIQSGIHLLKEIGKKFIPHVSPHILDDRNFTAADEVDSPPDECYKLISDNEQLIYRIPDSLKMYQGLVGECKAIYPRYGDASAEFLKGLWVYKGAIDGVVLENSWPLDQSNKTHNETALHLPYFSPDFEEAFQETPPWNLTLINNRSKYMQNHNKYGNDFTNAFRKILNFTTPVWSSSQWMNGDTAINRQNIDASWANLHKELIEAALGGISGHWLWSSPVCGDTENFDIDGQASLCVKWYMAGTFLPMLKIHSRVNPRDPFAFIGTHKQLIVEAIKRRLSLLPYLYRTLQEGPLLRPMFYQFPSSENLANINTQFSVGNDLVIVPNLLPRQNHVNFWMPPGTWYELWSGLQLEGDEGNPVTMFTTEADFFTAIRGGSILVIQKDTRETAEETRLHSAISLTIALDCKNNGTACEATGRLFVADNTWVFFEATETELTISILNHVTFLCDADKAIITNIVNEIKVFGLQAEFNNYDHYKYLRTSIDLCDLRNKNVFPLS